MEKIFLEREEGMDVALAKIVSRAADVVHLNLPRRSVFGEIPNAFVALAEETAALGKTIVIESVDEHILELAGVAGFDALQPVFARYERPVSDIIPRRRSVPRMNDASLARASPPYRTATVRKGSARRAAKPAERKSTKEETADFLPPRPRQHRIDEGIPPVFDETFSGTIVRPPLEPPANARRTRRWVRATIGGAGILAAAGVIAWFVLPEATVALTMKKSVVRFNEPVTVTADPALKVPGALVVPGEVLTARANLSLPFITERTETVSARASGVLTVYNSYSSAPQVLVRNTRFESPDKKIFRMEQQVTIPGAKVEGGNVTPSSATVRVIAEEAGESYNLPPSSGWRIPGFAGRPQYEGFYAEAKEGMKGGFVGERARPTAVELANARAKTAEALADALEGQFLIIASDRFSSLPESRRFRLVREEATPDPDDPRTFHLFGEGVMEQIVFEESTLKEALVAKAARALPGELEVREFSYQLSTSTPDFERGTLAFSAQGEGVFIEPFDIEAFRASVAGKREEELKAAVFALPGVEAAKVSLSPFFVRSVPSNIDKIEVVVE